MSERKNVSELRGLITNANTVFSTTARRNQDLQAAFRVLPTFLDQSRATLTRLQTFAGATDPLAAQARKRKLKQMHKAAKAFYRKKR